MAVMIAGTGTTMTKIWDGKTHMENKFVSRDEVLEIIRRTCGDYATAWVNVAHLPSLDVAPIVRGKWCWYPSEQDRQQLCCSVCEQPSLCSEDGLQVPTAYCPWCGANMTQK